MKRYYFYKPSKYRKAEREHGIIDFELCALYSEDVHYHSDGKNAKSFTYFDQFNVCASTKEKGVYCFKVDTGYQSSHGHWARNSKDLTDAHREAGFFVVSERDYNRLRRLAVYLLFRTVENLNIQAGDNFYAWSNGSYSRLWELKLINTNYRYNRTNLSEEMLNDETVQKLGMSDYAINEEINIFIFKPNGLKSAKFSIVSHTFLPRYHTLEESRKYLLNENADEIEELQEQQYLRLRRFCKRLMYEFIDLDISAIQHKQTHKVTVYN